jgi:hypothetical protein
MKLTSFWHLSFMKCAATCKPYVCREHGRPLNPLNVNVIKPQIAFPFLLCSFKETFSSLFFLLLLFPLIYPYVTFYILHSVALIRHPCHSTYALQRCLKHSLRISTSAVDERRTYVERGLGNISSGEVLKMCVSLARNILLLLRFIHILFKT